LDPLALLGAAILLSTAALVSSSVPLNLVLALTALVAALVGGLPLRRVALLAAPALLASASVAFSNALLSAGGVGAASSWAAAALPASRVLAVALPGLVAAVAIDPTGLADALVVRLRVPARAAYSVLAGLRLLPLLADEWAVLGRASRARGLGGSGVRARARQFSSMTFRLLVAALRRGGRRAVALDARGLRPDAPRTIARPVRWRGSDTIALLVATAALLVAASTRF
jgi:energy-coupling factor transport system permease protein